jgi:hypothetical protein
MRIIDQVSFVLTRLPFLPFLPFQLAVFVINPSFKVINYGLLIDSDRSDQCLHQILTIWKSIPLYSPKRLEQIEIKA